MAGNVARGVVLIGNGKLGPRVGPTWLVASWFAMPDTPDASPGLDEYVLARRGLRNKGGAFSSAPELLACDGPTLVRVLPAASGRVRSPLPSPAARKFRMPVAAPHPRA